jgi:hypothetical protein
MLMKGPHMAGLLEDPDIAGGDDFGLRIRHLNGRTVCVIVESFDPNAVYREEVKPQVRLNVLVIDGPPIVFGGDITKGIQDSKRIDAPCYAEGVLSSHNNIVRVLKGKAATGRWTVGRISRGVSNNPKNQAPWNFVMLDPKNAGDVALRQRGEQMLAALLGGSFQNPVAVDLLTGRPLTAEFKEQENADPAWAGAAPAQDPWQQAAPVQTQWPATADAAPPTAPTPTQADEMPPGMIPALWGLLDDATKQAKWSEHMATVAQRAPADQGPPVPNGVDPARWNAMSLDERRSIAAQLGGTY